MTTEDDSQRKLNKTPEDWQTRLVFADWLHERDDPRAEGYRSLGLMRVRPLDGSDPGCCSFTADDNPAFRRHRKYRANAIPRDWFDRMPKNDLGEWPKSGHRYWRYLRGGRRRTEDAAALAFAKLPAERRAELLAVGGSAPNTRTHKVKNQPAKKPKGKRK